MYSGDTHDQKAVYIIFIIHIEIYFTKSLMTYPQNHQEHRF